MTSEPTVKTERAGDDGTRHVGRYEIVAKLGAGAMGTVYRARDPLVHRDVALKVITAGQASGDTDASVAPADLFAREARAAGALVHPAIVTLYDAGRDGDSFYLAMELVEGETFGDELARTGAVPIARAVQVVADVADALDYAHRHGVVHRDIKPSNLMILPDGRVKVTDFGIARLTAVGGADAMATIGLMVGTPSYMSPEQIEGGAVDGRSDLFSLGVVLYEALTGQKPFRAANTVGVLHAITTGTPEPPHEVDPRVPEELSRITLRAMARRIEDRYEHAADLASDLRQLASSGEKTLLVDTTARTARAAARRSPSSGRTPWMLFAASAGLISIAAGAGFFYRQHRATRITQSYIESASSPLGAEIRLDGEVVGQTPYTFEVTPGRHELEFRLKGYYPAEATIDVPAEASVPVKMDLVARQGDES